ncbi:hypothetical protein ACHAQH_000983 [Verticillium albo-atrum]
MLPDGRINPGEMTSFNHYALGAVADWLHGSLAGISPFEPGPYGLVKIAWTLKQGKALSMELTLPPSCSAVVTLPSELRGDYNVAEEATRVANSGVHVFEYLCELDAWPPRPLGHAFMTPPEESPLAGE